MIWFFGIVVSIILLIATIKYPAISIVFLLVAGSFKGVLVMEGYRFAGFLDPVKIGGVLVALAIMYNYVKTGTRLRDIISIPLVIYLLLAAFLLFGLLYTSSPKYGSEKTLKFGTIVFVMFLGPMVLGRRLKEIKLIIWIIFILGIVYAIGTIVNPEALGFRRATFLEIGPLTTAGTTAMAAIIAFCFAITPYTSRTLKIGSILLMPLLLAAIVVTGSRGPFFGLWLCVLGALVLYRKHAPKIWSLVVVAATIFAIYLVFIKLPWGTTYRIGRIVKDRYEFGEVASVRTEMFSWVWKNARRHPFIGHGTGAYAFDRNSVDVGDWPHNIILELLYEGGLVGALLLISFLWLIFWRWRQATRLIHLYEPHMPIEMLQIIHIAGLLFLFNLLQAMKSFDIVGNRLTFFCAGLVLAVFNCVRYQIEEVYSENDLVTKDWQQFEGDSLQETQVMY